MTTIERFSPEFRRTHLGASQVPAAVGVSPYKTPIELWEEYVEGGESVMSDAMRLGIALEAGIAEVAAEILGMPAAACSTRVHPHHPWLVATPDRRLADGSLLQIKSTALATVIKRADIDDAWGEQGTDHVPRHVIAQCMIELEVERATGGTAEVDHVAALIPGRGVALFHVPWEPDVAHDLVARAEQFWRFVQERKEPPVDWSEGYHDYLRKRWPDPIKGRWIDADPGTEFVVSSYQQAIYWRDYWKNAADMAQNLLCSTIRDAEGLRTKDLIVPWRSKAQPPERDWKAINDAIRARIGDDVYEAILAENTTPRPPTRQFGPLIRRRK